MAIDTHDDTGPPHPRDRIAAVIGTPDHLDADAIDGVLDASLSATGAACLRRPALLDWNEFREVRL